MGPLVRMCEVWRYHPHVPQTWIAGASLLLLLGSSQNETSAIHQTWQGAGGRWRKKLTRSGVQRRNVIDFLTRMMIESITLLVFSFIVSKHGSCRARRRRRQRFVLPVRRYGHGFLEPVVDVDVLQSIASTGDLVMSDCGIPFLALPRSYSSLSCR